MITLSIYQLEDIIEEQDIIDMREVPRDAKHLMEEYDRDENSYTLGHDYEIGYFLISNSSASFLLWCETEFDHRNGFYSFDV